MAIEIKKRPYEKSFSGNPIFYQLFSEQAAADTSIFFEVRVRFRSVTSGVFETLPTLEYKPVLGVAKIDIKGILESVLSYNLPAFEPDPKTVVHAPGHTGFYYLQFREITPLNSNPAWNDSEVDYERFVILGGINYFKHRGNNFWVNYFEVDRPFLTWQQSGMKTSKNAINFLLWLNDSAHLTFRATAIAYFTDGSVTAVSSGIASVKGMAHFIPAGAGMWGIDDPAKLLNYWTIQVFDLENPVVPVPVSEVFRFTSDNRNDYNEITLHYRGSLGGLNILRVLGDVNKKLEYSSTEVEKTVSPDYFDGSFIQPVRSTINNKEKLTWSGNIGSLSKEDQDRLRDAMQIREVWWAREGKWWPVNITNLNMDLGPLKAARRGMPIEFTLADAGSSHYTPDGAALGDGVFNSNVCLAYVQFGAIVVDNSGASSAVTIPVVEVDPEAASTQLRYRVLNEAGDTVVADWVTQAYGNINLVLTKEFKYLVEVQSICTNNVLGKKVTTMVNCITGAVIPSGSSSITNNTPVGTNVTISITPGGTTINLYVGAYSTVSFNAGVHGASRITILLEFSPAAAAITVAGNDFDYRILDNEILVPYAPGFGIPAINDDVIIHFY